MQVHRRSTMRHLSTRERAALEKVRDGGLPSWSIRLTLEQHGLVRLAGDTAALTPAGREALRKGWFSV